MARDISRFSAVSRWLFQVGVVAALRIALDKVDCVLVPLNLVGVIVLLEIRAVEGFEVVD